MSTYAVGSLVRARGREWVVLPESGPDLLMLRPLGGIEEEVTGVYLPIEPVEPASFALPDSARVGDFRSSRLLRERSDPGSVRVPVHSVLSRASPSSRGPTSWCPCSWPSSWTRSVC
jgi:hypothetical protein